MLRPSQGTDALLTGRKVLREEKFAPFTGGTKNSASCFFSATALTVSRNTHGNSVKLGQV